MSASDSSSTLPAKPPVVPTLDTEVQDESSTLEPGQIPPETAPVNNASDITSSEPSSVDQPPLPDEPAPPLPNEEPPASTEEDGWEPVWDSTAQAFYFYNKLTQQTQWENPRVPTSTTVSAPQIADVGPPGAATQPQIRKPVAGGYDPAIHGDYDPNADYAKAYEPQLEGTLDGETAGVDSAAAYTATGAFNRFTGKWQSADVNPEKFSDENKSKRQMNAFFNVDAAANSHDGKSLKAERSGKKISKTELKAYRDKRREKKEEKKRAWLRD